MVAANDRMGLFERRVIAIEGLDGSGKSTTVKLLAERLNAAIIGNPPTSLAPERAAADQLEPDARRRWYLNANRVAMNEARAFTDRHVILDRSIASTLAFGWAERGLIATRFDLPKGFPLPDAIVLLALPENVRRTRHSRRGDTPTAEEGRLALDDAFRERVLSGYRNLCTHTVDARQPPDAVVSAILDVLKPRRSSGASAGER